VAEWLNAPVLKTGVEKSIVSSNLTGPAKLSFFDKDFELKFHHQVNLQALACPTYGW
jgi:hypothetical protein